MSFVSEVRLMPPCEPWDCWDRSGPLTLTVEQVTRAPKEIYERVAFVEKDHRNNTITIHPREEGMEQKTIASDGGHWYCRDGTPKYTVKAKNGNERNTTLADARKLNLVPSVTEILKVAAKPGLERWKIQQTLEAALTLPKIPGESLDDFAKRVSADSTAQADKARELGSAIHGAIERALNGQSYDMKYEPMVVTVLSSLEPYMGTGWRSEKSFASKMGYGGKVDAHSNICVADFKCKEFDVEDVQKGKLAYPEQLMQLAAYKKGLILHGVSEDADLLNIYISTSIPGLVYVHRWAEGEEVAFQKFSSLLRYWQLDRGYDSSFF